MSEAMTLSQAPFRVLYVEDDPDHRELTKEGLERRGPFVVDFAADLAQADQHIANTTYDAVLVDVALDKTEKTGRQGDDWIMANLMAIGNAFIAVVTAQKPRLRDARWLQEHDIPVVEKGEEESVLYDKLAHRFAPDVGQVGDRDLVGNDLGDLTADALTQKTLALFTDWVNSLSDPDVKDVWMRGEWLSPRDLQHKIAEPRSVIGREMASLFLDHLRSVLGLDLGEGK